MKACSRGHAAVASALLEHGADVNAVTSTGWTALRFALDRHELDAASVLLGRGADADIPDNEGRTPLHWVCSHRKRLEEQCLLDHARRARLRPKYV